MRSGPDPVISARTICESISDWDKHRRADRLEIFWPSGEVDVIENIETNQILTVREGEGLTQRVPFEKN